MPGERVAKYGALEPRTTEQIAGDQLLGDMASSYTIPDLTYHYDPDPEPSVWEQVFGDPDRRVFVYAGDELLGWLEGPEVVSVDGDGFEVRSRTFVGVPLLWEGDQA